MASSTTALASWSDGDRSSRIFQRSSTSVASMVTAANGSAVDRCSRRLMEQGAADLSEGQIDRLHAQLVSLANRFGMLEGSIARLRQRLDTVLGALDDGRTPRFQA